MTPSRVAAMRAEYSSEAYWRREMEIEYDALDGALIYPEFDPAIHVIPDADIPKRGCRYMSLDPHPRTPHAALWVLIDKWSDWYVYRDTWPSIIYGDPRKIRDDEEDNLYTVKEYAETFAFLEGNELEYRHEHTDNEYATYTKRDAGEKIIFRLMDQAGKGFKASGEDALLETYAKRYERYGIYCEDPKKSHQAGEDAIRNLLKSRRHEVLGMWPRLHIASSCRELITEFPLHRYQATRTPNQEKDLKQERAASRCHQLDNLRYLGTSSASYVRSLES
jgi:hypothetical protein